MRDKKRSIDKFVTLNVQQISATLDQVRVFFVYLYKQRITTATPSWQNWFPGHVCKITGAWGVRVCGTGLWWETHLEKGLCRPA